MAQKLEAVATAADFFGWWVSHYEDIGRFDQACGFFEQHRRLLDKFMVDPVVMAIANQPPWRLSTDNMELASLYEWGVTLNYREASRTAQLNTTCEMTRLATRQRRQDPAEQAKEAELLDDEEEPTIKEEDASSSDEEESPNSSGGESDEEARIGVNNQNGGGNAKREKRKRGAE